MEHVQLLRCQEKVAVDLVMVSVFPTQAYYTLDQLNLADSFFEQVGKVGKMLLTTLLSAD